MGKNDNRDWYNNKPRPISEWREDLGDKLWWDFPIQESPYAGRPDEDGFPDYKTHFTDIPYPEEP